MRWLVLTALLAGCGAPPSVDMPLTVTTGAFSVPAGTERTQCMYLPLPVDHDVAVNRFVAHMTAGSHHFNFFYLPPNSGEHTMGLGDCTEAVRIYLAGSQWPELDHRLPEGKAIKIPRGSWLALESHFVNATQTEQMGGVDITLHTVEETAVQDWVNVYFNYMQRIHVPPMTHATLSARCPAVEGTHVFLLTSHMHHFGEQFDIALYDDGANTTTPVYSSTDWSHPLIDDLAMKPIDVGPNQGFEFRCHYYNDRATDLYGGDSAENNEMCIMAAFYWPSAGFPYCLPAAVTQ
jgi:Copper type II ascorbate-dependent monooxygenase, C-terminal domain